MTDGIYKTVKLTLQLFGGLYLAYNGRNKAKALLAAEVLEAGSRLRSVFRCIFSSFGPGKPRIVVFKGDDGNAFAVTYRVKRRVWSPVSVVYVAGCTRLKCFYNAVVNVPWGTGYVNTSRGVRRC